MQGPTHLATGILIQKTIWKKQRALPLQHFLVAFPAIISHGILDRLASFTYHPPMPLVGDWFWISYHSVIAFLTIYIFLKYWTKYKFGLILSIIPDFDWIVLHFSNLFSLQIPFWKEPILHKFVFSLIDFLPPFSFLNSLPDRNLERRGVMLEFAVFSILITLTAIIGEEIKEHTVSTCRKKNN